MSTSRHSVFVTGATGCLGGAVARYMLSQGWSVSATVRDLSKPEAKALTAVGARLVEGSWDNAEALTQAMAGCDALFMNLVPSFEDFASDSKAAAVILGAAKKAGPGIKTVVYSSGLGSHAPEELGAFSPDEPVCVALKSKQKIEGMVRGGGFQSWTILRPGTFMESFLEPKINYFPGLADKGLWTTAMRPDTPIAMVDCVDIAAFGAAAIADPARFNGREIPVSGWDTTVEEMMVVLSGAVGREVKAVCLSDEEIEAQRATNPFIGGMLVGRYMSQFADTEGVKKEFGIPMHNFEEFLEREKELVRKTYSSKA